MKRISDLLLENADLRSRVADLERRLAYGDVVQDPMLQKLRLDDWYLGKIRILGFHRYAEDIDGWSTVITVQLCEAEGANNDDILSALKEHFTDQEGCGHEHDCCGCARSSVYEIFQEVGNIYTVLTNTTRNV